MAAISNMAVVVSGGALIQLEIHDEAEFSGGRCGEIMSLTTYSALIRCGESWNGQGVWESHHGTNPANENDYAARQNGMNDGDRYAWINFTELVANKGKKTQKPKPALKIDEDIFKKMVLPTEHVEEIVAVLKQHEKKDVLMKDWGLGEVFEYGFGMTFLFWGPPGTGKTQSAKVISDALGLTLKTYGAAELQSSTPGEYERNLKAAFIEAKNKKQVLFFDECDGMIQTRQGMGQIMSSESNCFLQELEKHEGIVILATNRVDALDEALERRIALILEFKLPDLGQRENIWKKLIPEKLPLGKGVTHEKLAEHVLTGGQIKNVLLNAARMAVSKDSKKVEMEHFERAIERIQKAKKAFSGPRSIARLLGMQDKKKVRSFNGTD